MTAALEGGEWSAARPGRTLHQGKTRYPFYSSLGGRQGRSGRAEYLVPTGIRSRTVQSVVSRYTDWATRLSGFVTSRQKSQVQYFLTLHQLMPLKPPKPLLIFCRMMSLPTLLCSSCWLSSCSRTIWSCLIISDKRLSFSRNVSPASAWCRAAAPSITALLTTASPGDASDWWSPTLWTNISMRKITACKGWMARYKHLTLTRKGKWQVSITHNGMSTHSCISGTI